MEPDVRAGFPFHITAVACPRCGQRVELHWGQDQRCPGCEERLAACGYCGEPLAGAAVAHKDQNGRQWLCAEHYEQEQREAESLREFETPEAQAPPPESARAVAARRHYEEQIREVLAHGRFPSEELFGESAELPMSDPPDAPPEAPQNVLDAYRFYEQAVMEQDWGSVRVYPWELQGTALYVVRCTTDGSDGWVELYDADGTALGCARTDWDCPVWKPRGVIRKAVFGEDDPEVRKELAEAVTRLRGDHPN
jgi:hypothetical protein